MKRIISGGGSMVEANMQLIKLINQMQTTGSGSITLANLPNAIANAKAAGCEWVYYDMENIWEACEEDRKDPLGSIKKAGEMIHAAGLKCLQANYWDKLAYKDTSVPYPKEVLWTDWWKAQAKYGDAVDIQLPGYPQNQPEQFGEMTQKAVTLIKKTNPNIEWILINMIEYMSYSKQGLELAWKAAKPNVQGRWLWLNQNTQYDDVKPL